MTRNDPVRLLHFTDLHLYADESRELYGVNTAVTFRAALAKALSVSPAPLDAILVTGDIAEDAHRETYERFHSSVSTLGVPVICCPGNHEDPAGMSSVVSRPPLQYCGAVGLRAWRIVALSSHVGAEDWGWLDAAELDRLERELTDGDEHVLVCLHHQAMPVGSPWLDSVGLRNSDALRLALSRHRRARGVLSGHVHQEFHGVRHGVRYLTTPSTCAQFKPGTRTCVMDLRPPAFRWLRLQPTGEIETEVVWLDELRRTARPPDSRREAVV